MGEDIEVTGSCAACGHQMQPEAHFCTSCGAPVLPPPRRRPLFVDEVEGTPQPAAALTYTGPAHSGQTTYADPPEEPSFFSNAEPVLPKAERPRRRRGLGGAILLALLIIAAAGVVGFTLGRGDDRTSTADGSSTGSPGSSAGTGSGGSPSAGPSAPPKEELVRIAQVDDHAANALVGSWVPQLAAVSAGVGGDAGWSDALSHYETLKKTYPDALLLDTGQWPSSYVKPGMYAVVVPVPARTSRPVLEWCVEHSLSRDECAAKLLATSGDPDDNYDAQ